jgi:twitching motility protein PilJ
MAFNFKLPGLGGAGKPGSADQTISDQTVMDSGGGAGKKGMTLGFLNQYSVNKQLQILGGALLLILATFAGLVYHDNRESTYGTAYIAASGEMRMLSQRLAKASSLALQGNPTAFKQLKDSRDRFSQLLERLTSGGSINETNVPPSPDSVQEQLKALTDEWGKTDKNASQLLEMEKNLIALGQDVATINNKNPQMLELSEQVAALKLQAGGGTREVVAANQLVMLTQRVAKNASALLVGDAIDPEVAFLLGKDTNTFRDLLGALSKGSETLRIGATTDPDTRQKLTDLEAAFKEYQTAVSGILGSMQRLVLAAGRRRNASIAPTRTPFCG